MVYKVCLLILLFGAVAVNAQDIYIDHVITVVNDLDSAVKLYEKEGFTVKPGKLHENGLINAHIKFKNNSSLELMSLKGKATDELSKTYHKLLQEKEGGVYIALRGIKTGKLMNLLESKGYKFEVTTNKAWNYITITDSKFLTPFFFIDYKFPFSEDVNYLEHLNQCSGFNKIYLEGNWQTRKFLTDIGLNSCDGDRFTSSTGSIIVIDSEHIDRPRITKVELQAPNKIIFQY